MIEDRQKRIRLWVGCVFAGLCGVAMIVGMVRDQPSVIAGAFLGGLVAGNVIPYSALKDLTPWGKEGGS